VIFEAEAVLGYAESRTQVTETVQVDSEMRQEWSDDADLLEGEIVEVLAGAA
jgi:hypothetical protein